MMSFGLRVLSLVVFISSCGRPTSQSETKFAIYPGDRSVGGPIGRLEMLKAGFSTNFAKISVCVQTTNQPIKTENLLLETKLAHAMWLSSAGYNEQAFKLFEFTTKSKCAKDDVQFSGVIALADFNNENANDNFKSLFNEPRIRCQTIDRTMRCQGTTTTLGWGGPGNVLRYSYPTAPEKWVKIENSAPSSITLSPYIEWHSLNESLAADTTLDSSSKNLLRTNLASLISSKEPSFGELVAFGNALAALKILTVADPVFPAKCQEFYKSGKNQIDDALTPKISAFRTLLHEVGHTFGLHHADNPSAEAITGPSATTSWDEARKQYISTKSSMAYGDSFAYLEDDDIKGVQAAAAEAKKTLAGHK